jgi:3D (Asp-Asp-Asp) domain-containing protein
MNIDRIRLTAKHILEQTKEVFKARMATILVVVYICGAALSVINTNSAVVTIDENGRKTSVFTFNQTAEDILAQAGIAVSKIDTVAFDGIAAGKGFIKVNRNKNVCIMQNGVITDYTISRDGSVKDALAAAGIVLDGDDYLSHGLDIIVPANTVIEYADVSYQTETKSETISSDKYHEIAKLSSDNDVFMIQDGEQAILTTTYRYRIVNGEIESAEVVDRTCSPASDTAAITPLSSKTRKKTVSAKKAKKSKAKKNKAKKAVSTSHKIDSVSDLKHKAIELDKKGRPVDYKKKISGSASAYTANDGARTSTGKIAQTGYVAVNPSQIPYGTKLYIVSKDGRYNYGYSVAADTGGFTKWGTRVVDLYFDTYSECVNFGVRGVDIYVLD